MHSQVPQQLSTTPNYGDCARYTNWMRKDNPSWWMASTAGLLKTILSAHAGANSTRKNRSTSLRHRIPNTLPNTKQAGVYLLSFTCPVIPLPASLLATTTSRYPGAETRPCKKLSDCWQLKP